MTTTIVDNRKYIVADANKLLYFKDTPIAEQVGICNVCIPLDWDENEIYQEVDDYNI